MTIDMRIQRIQNTSVALDRLLDDVFYNMKIITDVLPTIGDSERKARAHEIGESFDRMSEGLDKAQEEIALLRMSIG